jgi:hypothetical protein
MRGGRLSGVENHQARQPMNCVGGRPSASEPVASDLRTAGSRRQLDREHFAIDSRQVCFTSHPVRLWPPESVGTCIEYRGHGDHEYHHYGDFKLFWVGTEQKISKPKEARKKQ